MSDTGPVPDARSSADTGDPPGDHVAGAVFSALADPTRRAVLRAVAGRDGATATSLAARLPVSRQAVTKHLRALADAGLVRSERQGREQRFVATPGPLDEAVAWMAAVGAAWDDRLERLHHLVEDPAPGANRGAGPGTGGDGPDGVTLG